MTRPITGRVAPALRRPIGASAPGQATVGEPGAARIAVDLLGGDHAPAVVVDGALRACQADPALHLLLVGPQEAAGEVLRALPPSEHARINTLPIAPGDPVDSWVESGVRSAVLAVAQGAADAVMSAGNTGATVTSAALGLGRCPGVRRPPLAAVLPTRSGRLVLLDVGSSVDPDEETVATHARLGSAYARVVHGVEEPRIGLLTIGAERGKGDRLRRALPTLLAGLDLPGGGRYVGLVEGNDVVTGSIADVVVTDGFTGNVLLKGLETAYAEVGSPHPLVPPRAALLLGVDGTVVVCHGAASGSDLAAGIAFAAQLHRQAAVAAMAEMIETQRGVYE
ncbi:phosphate:acyl-[acyl carrier protein] acyltransferase [Paractinoplanes brasiliensis]|uniref:Phosphate acyltransferase n=1 Tax=Paractinoplanes brasiliensis TaxID=52695 RepID=A0A4R6K0K0_9ACTN|nr:phosphate:acyl-[acyl carrier protein] acyltransferase [Actinoplanes brasiliensis]